MKPVNRPSSGGFLYYHFEWPVYIATNVMVGNVVVFENRQPVTAAKFINKSSLFNLLLGVTRRLELKPISEQKAENIFVAPPYCQTACCLQKLTN